LASILSISWIVLMAATPAGDSLPPTTPSTAESSAVDTASRVRLVPRGVLTPPQGEHGEVVDPAGVATDAFGRVWISDAQLHRIQRFDRDGRWLGEAGALGSDVGQLRRPGSVAPLGAANMAVLDRENRRVLVYDLFGRLQGVRLDLAAEALESQTGRIDPGVLATDRGGALVITDPARERLLVFDTSGNLVRTLGGFGARVGFFRGLRGVAAAPRGELVVTERLNARVQRLDAGGRPVGSWPLSIDARASGALPIALDERGRVAVADETAGRLWLFDARGRRLAQEEGLSRPRALAFAPDGTLLVVEGNPARLRRFELAAPGEP
jgi:sugar lactone lactonase YvrE